MGTMSGKEFHIQTCAPCILIWIANFPNGKRIWMKLQLIWIKRMVCVHREGAGESVRIDEIKVNLKFGDIFNAHAIVSQKIIRTAERADDKPWSVYACKIISKKNELMHMKNYSFPAIWSMLYSRFRRTYFAFYSFMFIYFYFSKMTLRDRIKIALAHKSVSWKVIESSYEVNPANSI